MSQGYTTTLMGEWLGAHDACMMIGDASFRSTLDASLHPTLQNLHPLPPFALRPNKAYRLNQDLVDPEPQTASAVGRILFPHAYIGAHRTAEKKTPTTITPPSVSCRSECPYIKNHIHRKSIVIILCVRAPSINSSENTLQHKHATPLTLYRNATTRSSSANTPSNTSPN